MRSNPSFTSIGPDAVLHFAALTIAPESVRDPAPYWRVNTGGTLNLLDAMVDAGIPVIVFSSTAAVYGSPDRSRSPRTRRCSRSIPTAPRNLPRSGRRRHMPMRTACVRCPALLQRCRRTAGDVGEDHRPETHLIPSALDAAAGRREPLSVFGTDFPTTGWHGDPRLRPRRGPDRRASPGAGSDGRRRLVARRDQSRHA